MGATPTGLGLGVWFHERAQRNGGRERKTTIVALARKLLVALWKYVNAGVVIEGVCPVFCAPTKLKAPNLRYAQLNRNRRRAHPA